MSKMVETKVANGVHQSSKTLPIVFLVMTSIITAIVSYPTVYNALRVGSLEYIIYFRNEVANIYIDKSMNLLSDMADKYGIAIFFCISQAVLSPVNAQILLCSSCLSISLNIIVKMMIRDARPYFYSLDYTPVKCDFEYGSPSGHAQSATSFFISFVTLLFREQYMKQTNGDSFFKSIFKKKLFVYSVVIFYCAFISFSRIFVGLHTLEQILMGFGLGLIVHLLMCHIYIEKLERLFIGVETRKTFFRNPVSYMYFGANLTVIIFYLMINSYYPSPQSWIDNIQKT